MFLFDYIFNLIFRKLLKISTNVIPQGEIIQNAKRESRSRGWEWKEPVRVYLGVRYYTVLTNYNQRGGNIKVTINAYTGKIKDAYFWPR